MRSTSACFTLNSSQFLTADSSNTLTEYGNFSTKEINRGSRILTDTLVLQSWQVIERVLLASDSEVGKNTSIRVFLRSCGEGSLEGEVHKLVLALGLSGLFSKESFHSIFYSN